MNPSLEYRVLDKLSDILSIHRGKFHGINYYLVKSPMMKTHDGKEFLEETSMPAITLEQIIEKLGIILDQSHINMLEKQGLWHAQHKAAMVLILIGIRLSLIRLVW